MRKPRSTVYVRPGKDITLYVPSDTPKEVCDYLNSLKEQGIFSQCVIEIITNYVKGNPELSASHAGGEPEVVNPLFSNLDDFDPVHNDSEELFDEALAAQDEALPQQEIRQTVKRRLSLSEIFNQAKKNSIDKP